jgi:nonsense-mediated mRNA decay protein 3
MDEEGVTTKKKYKQKGSDGEDYEEFLDDVGKDKEMRKNMNLYRDEEAINKLSEKEKKKAEKARPKKVPGRKMIKVCD